MVNGDHRIPTPFLLALAMLSRFVLVLLIVIADVCLDDHFPGDDVARFPSSWQIREDSPTAERFLTSFTRWDAAHYLSIARDGYYKSTVGKCGGQETLAFYPTYPHLIRCVATFLSYGGSGSGGKPVSNELLVVSGLVISNGCFILSAIVLRGILEMTLDKILAPKQQDVVKRISGPNDVHGGVYCKSNRLPALVHDALVVTMNTNMVNVALISYICNPANIFFTCVYTESFYALMTFSGIWLLLLLQTTVKFPGHTYDALSSRHSPCLRVFLLVVASWFFLTASSLRSNGVLNVIFAFGYAQSWCQMLRATLVVQRKRNSILPVLLNAPIAIVEACAILVLLVSCVAPYFMFNEYIRAAVCPGDSDSSTCSGSGSGGGSSSSSPVHQERSVQRSWSAVGERWVLPSTALYRQSISLKPPTRLLYSSCLTSSDEQIDVVQACCASPPLIDLLASLWETTVRMHSASVHIESDTLSSVCAASTSSATATAVDSSCCLSSLPSTRYCSMYAAIQRKHWDVGFLRHFHLKQIPNFLLATPIVFVAMVACRMLLSPVLRKIRDETTVKDAEGECSSQSRYIIMTSDQRRQGTEQNERQRQQHQEQQQQEQQHLLLQPSNQSAGQIEQKLESQGTLTLQPIPISFSEAASSAAWAVWTTLSSPRSPIVFHALHLAAVIALGVFVAHVQISTRLICSSCPVIYLGFSSLMVSTKRKGEMGTESIGLAQRDDGRGGWPYTNLMTILYLVTFNILGICLHPNFYPWT